MRGYAGKFLEIDLSSGAIKELKFSEKILVDYIGGRGLATKILWDRLGSRWEKVDPLGPENILLVLTGPLTGYAPGTKICISGKSPQSNGVIGSTVAGEFGVDLKCAGYDGLIITGEAEKPSYIFICDNHVEIKDAKAIWGKKARESLKYLVKKSIEDIKTIKQNYGEVKEPSILYVGPAGENRTRVAAVMAKYTHGAGYGGYGGVMGSKKLKAIVVKGFGPLPEVHDLDTVLQFFREISKRNFELEHFRRFGTGAGGYYHGAVQSSEPIRNWQEEWHNRDSYRPEEFDKFWVKKYWGDFGCAITCLKLAVLRDGKFKGAICDNPDYENQAYVGTNLGIFSPEDNIYLSYIINELGMCGIQGGAVLGFAAELYEKGILSEKDLEGIKPEWGDTEAFAALAEKIAYRQGIGDILAEGVYRAARKISKIKGIDVSKYAVHVKGVAVGAHGVRSGKDDVAQDIGYACSVQAGDHTSAASLPPDRDSPAPGELRAMFLDSAVLCMFTTTLPFFKLEDNEIFRFYEAVTGYNLSREEWYNEKALRILHLQRTMLLLGGPDACWRPETDDDNPPRFWEPLPSGPCKGKTLDRKKFEENRLNYYRSVGWDERGIPKPETLEKLGLHEVIAKLKEVGYID
ncbi:MAG: aldehyde ferredoxin oxidoreductase C-terminal domain-containing protein [Candidatus Bathyarchaeia archaeon]|nr:aldehyde ferredoxin oxidoreductase [Candidatus Bathyarchaeota archaeon]